MREGVAKGYNAVYLPGQNRQGNIFSTVIYAIKNVIRFRYLLGELVKVTLLFQYKHSLIGGTWLVIFPVLAILNWLLFHHSGILETGDVGIPYPAYILLSTSLWTLFLDYYRQVSQTMVNNGKLFMMNKFPREVVLTEKIAVASVNFIIPFALNIIVLLLYGVEFHWKGFLFPVLLIPMCLLGISIGIIFSIIRVVTVDFYNLFDKIIVLWMYVTPVVFSTDIESPLLQQIMKYNPLTYLLAMPREVLIKGEFFEPTGYLISSAGAIVLFLVAVRFFIIAENRVIERITAS